MKNKDKKILLRGTILTVVLLVIVYSLNFVCRIAVLNERYEIINNIKYQPKDNIDIMIVGNSHAQEGINAQLMSDSLDANVYNFSFSQQQTAIAYYFLKNNLNKQSPKIVMLEAYTLIQQLEQGGAEFIPLSPAKIKYYNMIGEEGDFISCFFPIAANHNFWAAENPFGPMFENINAGKNEVAPFFSMKIMSEKAIIRHENYNSESYANPLFEYRLAHLLEIKEVCKKSGAQLMIFMLPLYKTMVDRIDYDGMYYDKIKAFCDENDILYYDFNKESETDWSYKYFREQDYTRNTHLNSYGQILASEELAQYLANTSDYFSVSTYDNTKMEIKDFLGEINLSNNLLFIDDCPASLNNTINPDTLEYLRNLNIELRQEKNGDPEIYFISGGTVIKDYILPENIDYSEDAVTIYELDSSGAIIRHAVTRWDEFSSVIIR